MQNVQDITNQARLIKCLISDVDGVLTDGLLYIDNQGNELKAFHVQDGMGLKLLMAAGIHVSVITTSSNQVIENRMAQLGIEHFFKGQINKEQAFAQIKERLNLKNEEIAYIGDDLPDLSIMQQVGLSIAVANAVPEVKKMATWQTEQIGGRGAVREICDLILKAQHKFELALKHYLTL